MLDPEASDKSRQKSCNACVRSKRRCDKRTPKCTRCAEKGFTCLYQKLPLSPDSPRRLGGCGGVGVGVGAGGRRVSGMPTPTPTSTSAASADVHVPHFGCGVGDRRGQDTPHEIDFGDLGMLSDDHDHDRDHDQSPPSMCADFDFSNSTAATSTSTSTSTPAFSPPHLQQTSTAGGAGAGAGGSGDPTAMLMDPMLSLDEPNFAFNNLMNYMTVDPAQTNDMALWQTTAPPEPPKITAPSLPSPPPFHQADFGDPCRHADACAGFKPWELHQPDSKVGFVLNYMKAFPTLFARTKETPFLHRHLYRHNTPRSILNLYAVTSAYAARNDSNRDWALRVLWDGCEELLTSQDAGSQAAAASKGYALAQVHGLPSSQGQGGQSASTTATGAGTGTGNDSGTGTGTSTSTVAQTPYEKLARTQALYMYQLMRINDGDIGLRAMAERDMPTLELWLEDLKSLRDNLAEQCLLDEATLKARPPKSWERWLFQECVRRTTLMGYGFLALYTLLKNPDSRDSDPSRFSIGHRWTASRALWEADSSIAFFAAWRDRPQSIVQNFFIQDFARRARPEDVDSFTRMVMTPLVGVEEMNHFMGDNGNWPGAPGAATATV